MSARHLTNQDRRRREAWARRIAADQRREAERAAAIVQNITSRIRSIETRGRTRPSSVGGLQGAGVVTAILPNGRRTRMRIVPTLAPITDVNRLRSVITVNERRQAIAVEKNSRAIAALAAALAAAVKKLTAEQVKSDRDLRKRLVEGGNLLDRRSAKKVSRG
jgi:hypothetical protein